MPRRRMILQFSQTRLTLARTFITHLTLAVDPRFANRAPRADENTAGNHFPSVRISIPFSVTATVCS